MRSHRQRFLQPLRLSVAAHRPRSQQPCSEHRTVMHHCGRRSTCNEEIASPHRHSASGTKWPWQAHQPPLCDRGTRQACRQVRLWESSPPVSRPPPGWPVADRVPTSPPRPASEQSMASLYRRAWSVLSSMCCRRWQPDLQWRLAAVRRTPSGRRQATAVRVRSLHLSRWMPA